MTEKRRGPKHRGRTKEGATPITIRLTPDELERLERAANEELRSRTAQATWFVTRALRVEWS